MKRDEWAAGSSQQAILWDYMVDPAKNIRFQADILDWVNYPADGRMGMGSSFHSSPPIYHRHPQAHPAARPAQVGACSHRSWRNYMCSLYLKLSILPPLS